MEDKKISELNDANQTLQGNEVAPIVQNGETVKLPVSLFVTVPDFESNTPFKKLIFSISQIGTDAPVLDLLFNNSSLDPNNFTSSRLSQGDYKLEYPYTDPNIFNTIYLQKGELSDTNSFFTATKFNNFKSNNLGVIMRTFNISITQSNTIFLPTDGLLGDTLIIINVNE